MTTDCEEVAIGETMTYTIKIKNHSRYYFEAIFVNESIEDTVIDYDKYSFREDFRDLDHGLDPYESRVIEIEITVPEHVAWYQVGDDYCFNLKPQLDYWVDESGVNPGLYGWGYTNMIGVDPIPIRITNLNDGEDIISVNFLETNSTVSFYDHEHESEEESHTFFGQLDGNIANYLEIKNLTDQEYEFVYLDAYRNEFLRNDSVFFLQPNEHIAVEVGTGYYIVPDEILDTLDISYHMVFKSAEGEYFASGVDRTCTTSVFLVPEISLYIEKQEIDQSFARLTNYGTTDIEDLVICYACDSPNTLEQLMASAVIETLRSGESIEIKDIPFAMELEGREDPVSNLRIGKLEDGLFTYAKVQYFGRDNDEESLYELAQNLWCIGMPSNQLYERIFPLEDILRGRAEHVIATPSPAPTQTPILPTSSAEPTSLITVVEDKRYYISPWVYHSIAAAAAVLVGLILYRRRKSV